MKNSYYNFYVPCATGTLCFNAKSDKFLILSSRVFQLLSERHYEQINPALIKILSLNGFIVDDEENEYENLLKEYHCSDQKKKYTVTLLPSLDCNMRCWYCFEKHITGSHLSSIQQNSIKLYVSRILSRDDVNHLHFSLFGGEPMLYFAEEVYPLLMECYAYAQKIGKKVTTSIITNGTFINEQTIPLLKNLNAGFQISIDGYRDKHNAIKKNPVFKNGTYDIVIKAIHDVTDAYNTNINLRINYDNQTLKHLCDIIKDIEDIDRRRIKIHLERVWQTKAAASPEVNISDVINEFLSHHFIVSYLNFYRRDYACNMDLKNQVVLSYDKCVYKCTGRDFTTDFQEGELTKDGHILWDEHKVGKRLSVKTYDLPICHSCRMLPQCWGLCSQKMLENAGPKDSMCPLKSMEMSIEEYICYRFNNEYITHIIYGEEQPISIV